MSIAEAAYLHCPIRGQLEAQQRAADGLTFTEEKHRIDAIRFLLQRGYPRDNFGIETRILRFGSEGRNSLRADFSVYEIPWSDVVQLPDEKRLEKTVLVAEIKRENASRQSAVEDQLIPALALLPKLSALGVYWDDIEQRFFYKVVEGSLTSTREAPISKIPRWLEGVGDTSLRFCDLVASSNLSVVFDEMEDCLHPYITDKTRRYAILFQLLLAKIWDEVSHASNPEARLNIQDFHLMPITDSEVSARMDEFLKEATGHYNRFLPEDVKQSFQPLNPEALRRLSQLIAPINILDSKQKVIQAFYMRFAKDLYKWDLAQYFTPA